MLKLRVPIRVIVFLFRFAIALKAVAHFTEKLGHFLMAGRMALGVQFCRERTGAFARPAQRGLRVPARQGFSQPFEPAGQIRIELQKGGTPCARVANPTLLQRRSTQFPHSLREGDSRQTTGAADTRHAALAQLTRFVGRHHPPGPFVEMGPYESELLLERPECRHTS